MVATVARRLGSRDVSHGRNGCLAPWKPRHVAKPTIGCSTPLKPRRSPAELQNGCQAPPSVDTSRGVNGCSTPQVETDTCPATVARHLESRDSLVKMTTGARPLQSRDCMPRTQWLLGTFEAETGCGRDCHRASPGSQWLLGALEVETKRRRSSHRTATIS